MRFAARGGPSAGSGVSEFTPWRTRSRSTATVADVAARYPKEHVALHCKPDTAKLYLSVVKRFIPPA